MRANLYFSSRIFIAVGVMTAFLIGEVHAQGGRGGRRHPQHFHLAASRQQARSPAPALTPAQATLLGRLLDANIDIDKLKNIQYEIETKLTKLDAEQKSTFAKMNNDIAEEKKKISDSERTIMHDYIGDKTNENMFIVAIIGLITGLSAIFVGVAIYIWKNGFVREVEDKITSASKSILAQMDSYALSIVDNIVSVKSDTSRAHQYCSLSSVHWLLYEEFYQAYLRKETTETEGFTKDIKISKIYAECALDIMVRIKTAKGVDYLEGEPSAFGIYTTALNHFVYHETALLLCSSKPIEDYVTRVSDVIAKASECLDIGRNANRRPSGVPWYELDQTSSFTLLTLGNPTQKQRAGEILQALFGGKPPMEGLQPAPASWLCNLYGELTKLAKARTFPALDMAKLAAPPGYGAG